jgi:predicted metal-dependent hydrolase
MDIEELRGATLEWKSRFSQGDYYGAHEVAEDAWHTYRGPFRDFLKGLVQVSVSLHHHFANNPHGAEVKWRSSRDYLRKYEPECLGIDVSLLLSEVASLYESDPFGNPGEGTDRPYVH